jgi:hypothetical protein
MDAFVSLVIKLRDLLRAPIAAASRSAHDSAPSTVEPTMDRQADTNPGLQKDNSSFNFDIWHIPPFL